MDPSDQPRSASGRPIEKDLEFFVLVKSRNLRQSASGGLSALNYHFFAEIFVTSGRTISNAELYRNKGNVDKLHFRLHSDDVLGNGAWYVEGGWYQSESDLDAVFPNDEYILDIAAPAGHISQARLDFGRAGGQNEIPGPARIRLIQNGVEVPPDRLDPNCDTVVTWGGFEVGCPDPRGIIDDQVFVVVADCFGNRIVKSGLSFEPSCLTYRDTEYTIPAKTLLAGRPHSMFVELPHVADSIVVSGVPGFATFATATYLHLHTLGEASGDPCPEKLSALDTGETDIFTPRVPHERVQLNQLKRNKADRKHRADSST